MTGAERRGIRVIGALTAVLSKQPRGPEYDVLLAVSYKIIDSVCYVIGKPSDTEKMIERLMKNEKNVEIFGRLYLQKLPK